MPTNDSAQMRRSSILAANWAKFRLLYGSALFVLGSVVALSTMTNRRAFLVNITMPLLGALIVVQSVFQHLAQESQCKAKISTVYQGFVQIHEVDSTISPLFQFRLWHLAVLVVVFALFLGIKRTIDDQFSPENAPVRGLRALHSSDPATRAWGATELGFTFIRLRPTTARRNRSAG